jgi:hypothetical protein
VEFVSSSAVRGRRCNHFLICQEFDSRTRDHGAQRVSHCPPNRRRVCRRKQTRKKEQAEQSPVWPVLLERFHFPFGNWLRQNRSPDSRLGESGLPSRGFILSGCKSSACPVLGVHSYGVVADSHRASRAFCRLVFMSESQPGATRPRKSGSRMELFC